ncbi:MAG: TonB family protein [Cyclobacteriaceae bacterium]|nr:TonB family protein [Cyclobacteriaceae bacterium]
MTDYTNDIARYLNGTMSTAERHAFEKRVLSDPFLAEALEGAEHLSADEFAEDVKALNNELLQPEYADYAAAPIAAASKRAAAPREKRAEIQRELKPDRWIWTRRIAAGLVILLISGYFIWQAINSVESPSTLALEETPPGLVQAGEEDSAIVHSEDRYQKEEPVGNSKETTQQRSAPDVSTKSKAEKETLTIEADLDDEPKEQPTVAEVKPVDSAPKHEIQTEELAAEKENLAAVAKKDATDRKKQEVSRATGAPSPSYASNVIRGRVTSKEDGSPLPGVNVVLKGTNRGTVTDIDGNYQIESTVSNPTLAYSFIGLQSTEVNAADRNEVDVSMSIDATQLSEVVVTGYGISNSVPYTPTVDLAHPENGNRAYQQYLEKNIQYPEEARANKVQGRVTVEFYVETNGNLSEFKIIRGIGSGCDEELIRLIKDGPKWIPTKKDNTPIRDKARVRLKFDLPK